MNISHFLPVVQGTITSFKMSRNFTRTKELLSSTGIRFYSPRKNLETSQVKDLLDNATVTENEFENNEWSTSNYLNPRLQSNHALRPRVDPRETSILLFPGEGSQYVGMGQHLLQFPGVRDMFQAANEILKYNLLSLCMTGPKSKLDETKYAQVAVMLCSFAALEKLKEERPTSVNNCIATAGFGIGELTALTFAGAIPFERAVRLAQLRGEAMQLACEMEQSGMLTVMYNPATKIHEVLRMAKEHAAAEGVEKPVCEVAHYLFPHCKVLAGHTQCLDYIEKNLKELQLNKARRLAMNGAFHTQLMEPAVYTFRKYLARSKLEVPVIAVHSGLDGKCYQDQDDIVQKLPKLMMKPVKWEQVLHVLYERPVGQNFPYTFLCGPGDTLKTLLKMVNSKAYDVCENV